MKKLLPISLKGKNPEMTTLYQVLCVAKSPLLDDWTDVWVSLSVTFGDPRTELYKCGIGTPDRYIAMTVAAMQVLDQGASLSDAFCVACEVACDFIAAKKAGEGCS